MRIRINRSLVALLCLSACMSCADEEAELSIDLRTDYVPNLEFTDVRIRLRQAGELRDDWHRVGDGDYVRGQRISRFRSVARGPVELDVELYGPDGATLLRRPASVFFAGATTVTLVLTRSCEGVSCAEGLACSGSRCVDAECTPETPERCGDGCELTPCTPMNACAASQCTSEGACLYEARPGFCDSTEYCDPEAGCRLRPGGPRDSGMPDAGSLDAGARDAGPLDAGSDASMDASVNPSCGEVCDTGNVCERGIMDCSSGAPRCESAGAGPAGILCRGARDLCDAEERCDGVSTDCPVDRAVSAGEVCSPGSACDIEERCDGVNDACPLDRFEDVGELCPGGFCNAAHECSAECSPGATCELSDACQSGRVDCSTGTPRCLPEGNAPDETECRSEETTRGLCGGYSDDCDTGGMRLVTTRTFECQSGSCVGSDDTISVVCSRATNGNTCGSTSNTECTDPDTCFAGTCRANHEPNGFGCGSSLDNQCTDPDTCLNGACQTNDAPMGAACGNDADTACTAPDTCAAGTCRTNHRGAGTACSDGDACTVGDSCDAVGSCSPGATMSCNDGLSCTSDSCSAGVCQNPVISDRCLIAGSCYVSGQPQAGNTCFNCNPVVSQTSFSMRPTGSLCFVECEGMCTSGGECNAPPAPFCE